MKATHSQMARSMLKIISFIYKNIAFYFCLATMKTVINIILAYQVKLQETEKLGLYSVTEIIDLALF